MVKKQAEKSKLTLVCLFGLCLFKCKIAFSALRDICFNLPCCSTKQTTFSEGGGTERTALPCI